MLVKFLHILVIINLLAASVGLSVYEHSCKIKGKSYSFYFKEDTCCTKNSEKACVSSDHHSNLGESVFKKKKCCDNKQFHSKLLVQSQEFIKISLPDFKFAFPKPAINFSSLNDVLTSVDIKTLVSFFYQSPPDQRGNLRILFQSFLC